MIKDAFNNCQALCAVSQSLANDIKNLGVNRHISVVGNIVDAKIFMDATAIIGQDLQHYHFVSVAYLRPIKQLEKLILAFNQVSQVVNNAKLTIIGDGTSRKSLEQLTRKLKIQKQVSFTGEISRLQIAKLLAQAHCYVLTSQYETFSVAVHEALASGLAVISFPCGGPEPILKHLKKNILSNHSLEKLATAMLTQAQQLPHASRDQNAQKYIAIKFSYHAIGSIIERILFKAIANNSPVKSEY
jgi:glycosyltransferase involved in cell wall biosynthesis